MLSPITSPSDKEAKSLMHKIKELENELSKKTALFDSECKFMSEKSEKDKNIIMELRTELREVKGEHQKVLQEKRNQYEVDVNSTMNKLDEATEKIREQEHQIRKKCSELETEKILRRNNEKELSDDLKTKNLKIQELEENLW